MNINIETFIEFPGILITIGGILLLASIIIGIIAYRKEKDVISAGVLDGTNANNFDEEYEALEKPPIEKEQTEVKPLEKEEEIFTFPPEEEIEDIKTEPIPIINENNLTSFEEVTVVPTEVVNETEVEKEEKPEINDEKVIKQDKSSEEKTTLIYGGFEPTGEFNFSFNKEKATFEEKQQEQIIQEKYEEQKTIVPQINEEEDIELL